MRTRQLLMTVALMVMTGSAAAADVPVNGVPRPVQRGNNSYVFVVHRQTYIIPMTGFGSLKQADLVDDAFNWQYSIYFISDPDQLIDYRAFENGGFVVHQGVLAHAFGELRTHGLMQVQ